MRESYRLREIPENPFDFVKLSSKKENFEADVYDREEVRMLLDKIDGELIELPISLMLLAGLRFAEACGLRWSNIDFNRKTVNIN